MRVLLGVLGAILASLSFASCANHGLTVPNVVGLPTKEAGERILSAGFTLSVTCRVDHKKDHVVISQDPPSGAMAVRGSTVEFIEAALSCLPSITTTTTSASGLVPALQTHNPTVTVTPSTNLIDGQQVEVTVTGFGQGGKFYLSECASAADANSLGCGPGLPAQPFGVTNNSGSGSFPFTVASIAATMHDNTSSTVTCADRCVLVATVGGGYGYVFTPLAFASP